jgi:hypothetical protein
MAQVCSLREGSGLLALLGFRGWRIGQRLQLDNGRSPVNTPDIHDFPTAGNPSRQGQNLGLSGRLVFGELHLEGDLVATELSSFLVELGGFCPRGIQLAAQFAIAALQHLKETNVLKTFGMEFFPGQPGIGRLLGDQRGSGNPYFAPGEDTGQDTPGDGDS